MKKFILTVASLFMVALTSFGGGPFAYNLFRTTQFVIADNTTTNLPAAVYNDAPIPTNPDGSLANCGIFVSLLGAATDDTNTITFTLQSVVATGVSNAPTATTASQNRFVFIVNATAVTNTCVITNVPTSFLQGASHVRLNRLISSDAAGNTNVTITAKLVGFAQ